MAGYDLPSDKLRISEWIRSLDDVNAQQFMYMLNHPEIYNATVLQTFARDRSFMVDTGSLRKYRTAHVAPKSNVVNLLEAAPPSTFVPKTGPGKYLITSAQNNSVVHLPFLNAALNYCNIEGAQLVVLPIRYRNVSAMHTGSPSWDTSLSEYYLNTNLEITKGLTLKGKSRIAATASDPLSGWNSVGGTSAVFGHGQVSLKAIPTPLGQVPALLMSTGSITEPNFANAKVSEIAEFHHTIGGLLITVHSNGLFDFEWAHFKDDGFYTLSGYFSCTKETRSSVQVDDLILGDWHSAEAPVKHKEDAYFLMSYLMPDRIWLHDPLSFLSESHHLNPIDRSRFKLLTLQEEVEMLVEELEYMQCYTNEVYCVDSNHSRHVDRWLNDGRVMVEANRSLYHKAWAAVLDFPQKSPFECFVYAATGKWVLVPPRDGYRSHGIELGLHGDIGANGSRGSARGLAGLSNKVNSGHGHSPEWHKGSLRQGTTGPMAPSYARGYNASMLVHSVIYANGARTLFSRVQAQVKGL